MLFLSDAERAQLKTRHRHERDGLLINFNVKLLREGIRQFKI